MKILYFYPENPLLSNQGNHVRAISILNYFKDRKIEVDFVSEQSDNFSHKEIEILKSENLISAGFLLKKYKRKNNKIQYFFKYSLPNKFLNQIKLFNRIRFGHQKAFNTILKENSYDFIIISYACWAELIKNNTNLKNAKTVIDTHDFLTAQFKNHKTFQLGKFFEKEITLLKMFNKILVISIEEKYLFSQFTNSEVHLATHSLPNNFDKTLENKKYDIIYVASENEHNKKSIKWFFEKVYPLLNKNLKILIIGSIIDSIDEYPNVEKIKFVKVLDDFYSNSKVVICPMLSGTGLKIKVIEALSFGLPVVCNDKGIDGFLNKTNNGCLVTNSPIEFSNYINELLTNLAFYEKTSNLAKEYFLHNNDTTAAYIKFDKIFQV